jgi:hypothetical protein
MDSGLNLIWVKMYEYNGGTYIRQPLFYNPTGGTNAPYWLIQFNGGSETIDAFALVQMDGTF